MYGTPLGEEQGDCRWAYQIELQWHCYVHAVSAKFFKHIGRFAHRLSNWLRGDFKEAEVWDHET